MFKRNFLFVAFIALFFACNAQNKVIPFNSPDLRYEGRILYRTDASELTWSATSVSITFEGSSISAVMQDLDTANYYNVVVDNKVIKRFHSEQTKKSYELVNNLPKGKHTVELFKLTEWDKGKTLFYGFETPGKAKILPTPAKTRKIEFFGNSITCGYAVEDSINDSWFGYFQNAYVAYGAITARHFNAQLHSTSKSGIGILVSWFPLIESEMYDRLDPFDSTSKWDFSKYTPDIVVINLFQNDSWIVEQPGNAEFKHRFGTQKPSEEQIVAAYKSFVTSVRSKYPQAHIICALGNMDATREGSAWSGYIQKAVSQMNDAKIYTHFFPYKNTPGHPRVTEQKAMADSLISFIEKNIKW
jgi:lysophospholipase L1-like esterase